MNRPDFNRSVSVGIVTLGAFAVRAVSLDAQSLWRDEVDALRFATVPLSDLLANFIRHGWNGPLYFLLLRGWITLTGSSEYAMRFFSLAFGVLCVPLVFVLGRRLFGSTVGLLAALLVTASPYLVWYSQEVKMYTMLPVLAVLAVYGLRRAVDGGGFHWWAVQVVAISLAVYSHILAVLLIPVHVLLYFIWWPQSRDQWIGGLISLVCLTLPYLPLAAWQASLLFQVRETGFLAYTLGKMVEISLTGWSLGIVGWSGAWGTVLMGAMAVWGVWPPSIRHPQDAGTRGRLAMACWLAVPLLIVWLVSLWQPLFTDRYLVWTTPAFYLLVAAGVAFLWGLEGWGRRTAILVISAILVVDGGNLYRQAASPIKSDFRAAAAYVADHRLPPARSESLTGSHLSGESASFRSYLPLVVVGWLQFDELIMFQIPYARHAFDYYFTAGTYRWADGLYTNHLAPDGSHLVTQVEVARQMRETMTGHDSTWLIATEMAMWDGRGLVQSWLDANMRRVDEVHFAQVDVYHYVR